MNRKRTLLVTSVFCASVFVPLHAVALLASVPVLGLVAAVAVAVVALVLARARADDVVLELSEAEAASEIEHARLFNVTAGLCVSIGVAPPKIYVVDDPAINAMSVGVDARRASLVVTSGALEQLSVIELEALVSLQLHRVRVGDVTPETLAVTTIGLWSTLAELTEKHSSITRALSMLSPISISLLSRLHSKREDMDADVAAVGYTRFPPALASALDKMRGRSALAVGTPATAHLWAASPLGPATKSAPVVHTTLEERVAVLQEL